VLGESANGRNGDSTGSMGVSKSRMPRILVGSFVTHSRNRESTRGLSACPYGIVNYSCSFFSFRLPFSFSLAKSASVENIFMASARGLAGDPQMI
jgi:hypothetical protein